MAAQSVLPVIHAVHNVHWRNSALPQHSRRGNALRLPRPIGRWHSGEQPGKRKALPLRTSPATLEKPWGTTLILRKKRVCYTNIDIVWLLMYYYFSIVICQGFSLVYARKNRQKN